MSGHGDTRLLDELVDPPRRDETLPTTATARRQWRHLADQTDSTPTNAPPRTPGTIHRRQHPDADHNIPVIYITVPPAATPRMIAVEFARFLGLPLPARANITDVLDAVCRLC
nr:hypothetical protein [Frankia sp. Cj3]